jgi:hypothetical protein
MRIRIMNKIPGGRSLGIVFALGLFGALGATNAKADTTLFTVPAGAPQTTNWDAANVNLGIVFNANSNFSLDALGVYYQGSSIPTTNGSEMVGLYDGSGTLLASTTVLLPASGPAGYVFSSITPVALTAGDQYTLDAYTNGNSWAYGTNLIPDPRIAYVGTTYIYTGSLAFPIYTYFGNTASYYGPNATVAAVPEPGFYGFFAVNLLGLFVAVSRRLRA